MKNLVILSILFTKLTFGSEAVATFAGGCFWCMEPPFEKLAGVSKVISGYSDGDIKNPSYEQVSSGKTKHIEAVQVHYDPSIISYQKLVRVFWKNIDPTDKDGQFVDKGYQYTTAIFYHDDKQKKIAKSSNNYIIKSKNFEKSIVTPIKKFKSFYPAEEYHQDYYKKSLFTKAKYKYYRNASGRDNFINKHWKDFSFKKVLDLKTKLTPLQYKVTQKDGTEPPFKNKYWNNKKEGIYVDVVSGEPLFSSTDKFKSGTGWPSFTRPLVKTNIIEKTDYSLFGKRVEVRSKGANSHLGHVFKDGPKPSGLRYCINSASLRFIEKKHLKKEGYKKFTQLFDSK